MGAPQTSHANPATASPVDGLVISGPLPQLTELSPQERRIVALISLEYQTKEVARELGISGETVKTHLRRVYAKLGVHTRAGLVARAYTRLFD